MTTDFKPTIFFNGINFNSSFYNDDTSGVLNINQGNKLYLKRAGDITNGIYTFNNNMFYNGSYYSYGTITPSAKFHIKDNTNWGYSSVLVDGSNKPSNINTGISIRSNNNGYPYFEIKAGNIGADIMLGTTRLVINKSYNTPTLISQQGNNTYVGGWLAVNSTGTLPTNDLQVFGTLKCNNLLSTYNSSIQSNYNNAYYPLYAYFTGQILKTPRWISTTYTNSSGSNQIVQRFFNYNNNYTSARFYIRGYINTSAVKPNVFFRPTSNGSTISNLMENNIYCIKRNSGLVAIDTLKTNPYTQIMTEVEANNLNFNMDIRVYKMFNIGMQTNIDCAFTWAFVGSSRTMGSIMDANLTFIDITGFMLEFNSLSNGATLNIEYTIDYL